MRVAIDLRCMQDRPYAGVGRLMSHLAPLLAERVEVHALLDAARPGLGIGVAEHLIPTPPPGLASGWLQWSARRWLVDFQGIFHCPWYGLPYRLPVPGVATLHDLTFEHHPAWMGRAKNAIYRAQARQAARSAAAIITDTETVRQDIVRTYDVDPARVLVAHPALDPAFRPDLPRAEGVPDRYVVAVGGAARRNLPLAVATWQRAAIGVPLVVVGAADDLPAGAIGLGRASDEQWARVLSHADALVYPTAYEGFGLPALEAIASGTPVVCARVGALPEVLGDSASWSSGLGPDQLAAALRGAVGNDALRSAGIALAARRPTWEAAAEIYVAAYRLAAGA